MWTSFPNQYGKKYMMVSHWLIYILSERLIADVDTCCNNAAIALFVAAMCRTKSNQFEFVWHIAATKFCPSRLFVAKIHHVTRGDMLQQHVAPTCHLVCADLNAITFQQLHSCWQNKKTNGECWHCLKSHFKIPEKTVFQMVFSIENPKCSGNMFLLTCFATSSDDQSMKLRVDTNW